MSIKKLRHDAEMTVQPYSSEEAAQWAKRFLALLDAVEFYASGDWNDNYPGGVTAKGFPLENLDHGDAARYAIKKAINV